MAITFPNLEFPGTHGAPEVETPAQRSVLSTFAGVNGEIELILGRGGRGVSIPIVIHGTNLTTPAAVVALLDKYDQGVGYHGDLQVSGAIPRTFKNCTFQGFRIQGSILKDVGGTLNADGNESADYYFAVGSLQFRQISVEA